MPDEPPESSDDAERTVLVVGATGNQGGAVVDHLLDADDPYAVRGLTRDPDSDAARILADRGVEVVRGDLEERASLGAAVDGADAAFVVTNYWAAGYDGQRRQCENVADALADADVEHVVFTGAGYHDRDLGLRSMEPAHEAERYMRDLNLPLTVLRPVWFMHNLEPAAEEILDGTLALPLEPDVRFQMVDVDDVARATLTVLRAPEEFVGQSLDLAGDEHTLGEMADIASRVTGVDVDPVTVPLETAREEWGDQMANLFAWFNEGGYDVDIDALEERLGFRFTRFEEYLEKNGWADKREPARIPGFVKAMMEA